LASYQDIDTRLAVIESMVQFIMTTSKMKGIIQSDVLQADGTPERKVLEGSLLDFYLLAKTEHLPTEIG
jgi:hypothetical protein